MYSLTKPTHNFSCEIGIEIYFGIYMYIYSEDFALFRNR